MRKQLIFICTLLCFAFHAQNWNVFNKNYRYNYKFDHSDLVSNVLFVDSVKQTGADTIYALNRIGVECTGSCPTITAPLSPTISYVVANMPQFLQRRIKKYANGLVMLLDTSKQVIIPTCTLTQTWRFDSINNLDATCVSVNTLNVFGQNDSVKTILINGIDTLLLSKNFGVLQFPEPYNKNKYYRLVGIEKKNSYDQTALYGEKVPNAWDFYSKDAGDVICSISGYNTTFNQPSGCSKNKITVLSKILISNEFVYTQYSCVFSRNANYYGLANSCSSSTDTPSCGTSSYSPGSNYLSSPNLVCNTLYPNKMYSSGNNNYPENNIVKFGRDNQGRFYKYCGRPCPNNGTPILPNLNAIQYLQPEFYNLYSVLNNGYYSVAVCFGEGFGQIRNASIGFEHYSEWCLTSYFKGGVMYFGGTDPIGIEENNTNSEKKFFHPNPASTKVMLPEIEGAHVKVYNSLGQLVLSAENQSSIDVSSFSNGIYLLTLENSSLKMSKKLVVEH